MRLYAQIIAFVCVAGSHVLTPPLVDATILDDDDNCQRHGCVLVHDGDTFNIYDVYDEDRGRCCIAVGTPLAPRFANSGEFNLNLTGTLADVRPPDSNEGIMFGVSQDSGATYTSFFMDDGDGFLDASDTGIVFGVDQQTDIGFVDTAMSYSHSFFITSKKTRFSIRAQANLAQSSGEIADNVALDDIAVLINVTHKGDDDGFSFGDRAHANQIIVNPAITTLADLASGPVEILRSNRKNGIAKTNNGNGNGNNKKNTNLSDQTIRLDLLYTIPEYDLSMGTGALDIDMIMDFYREQ